MTRRGLAGWLLAIVAAGAVIVWLRPGKAQPGPATPTAASTSGGSIVMRSRAPRLEAEQAKAYAENRQADAICLLALGRATGDPSWLARALAEHPEDPRVQLERWNMASTPEEKLAAARALQAAAPNNPLGAYLEAGQAFDNRDLGAVARLMVDAEASQAYDAYTADITLETQSAFKATGLNNYDAWEAAELSSAKSLFETAMQLRQLGDDMGELQHVFVEMGYWDEADFMFERTLTLGEQMEASGEGLEGLVGLVLQNKLLSSFDPETIAGPDGSTAGERLARIKQASSELNNTVEDSQWKENLRKLDDTGWEQYQAIYRRNGQLAAIRWLMERK